ncbi:MAG: 50S ribosomal protein L10 [Candidatus Firestonebacteria bacterium]|nr:50S ribosomal protein L10 [Candidatus Firestonebacteria bacterium]
MATTKAKKSQVLEKVRDYLQESKNLVFTEYRGMNVEQVTTLRTTLRKAGVKYKIVKNTLIKKLAKEMGMQDLDKHLKGPVGVVFLGKDVAAGAKTVLEFAKKNELFVIKAGYVEGKSLGIESLKALASLPPREVMLAILLGTLQAPIKGFMTVARGNTQKLVYALNALKDKKAKAA